MIKLTLPLSLFMLASAPILVKFSSLHPIVLLSWRLTFVVILLAPFMLYKRPPLPDRADLLKIALVSLFLVGHFYTWFKGVPQLPVAVATLIYATNPIYTGVFSFILLREPYSWRYGAGLFLCLGGIYATLHRDIGTIAFNGWAVATMFTTAMLYSAYMTLAKKMRLNMPNTSFNFYLNLIAAILSFIILATLNAGADMHIEWLNIPLRQYAVAMSLALFPSLLGHTLMIYAVKVVNLNFVSIFKLLNPMISALLALWVFGEPLKQEYLVGLVAVLLGVLVTIDWRKQPSS